MYEQKPSLEELTHYGTKGMKWGVKKARTGDLQKVAARQSRVAAGGGSLGDKIKTAYDSSGAGLLKNGLKGEAARLSASNRAEAERLSTGKAKALDIVRAYGRVSIVSVIKSRKD